MLKVLWRQVRFSVGRRTYGKRLMMSSSEQKRKTIGTHSGTFHCDEAMAVWFLRQTEEFSKARVVRSRDTDVLKKLDVVVDVGGEYDASQHHYDHHQRGFEETFDDSHKTKLSSAGLVYKHFGREVVAATLTREHPDTDWTAPAVTRLYHQMYDVFVESLDGNDNGVSQYPSDVKPAYTVTTTLPSRVRRLNPYWNDQKSLNDDEEMLRRFEQAVSITGEEFTSILSFNALSWLPARELVSAAVSQRSSVHKSGRIVMFSQYVMFDEHLYKLEDELKVEVPIDYVIYPDTRGMWRVRAVSESVGSFKSRLPLPESWRGLRGDALEKVCGLEGAQFVHAAGFMAGHATKEGAVRLAELSLKQSGENK